MVDYSDQGFTIPIIKNGVKGYASIHAILYREPKNIVHVSLQIAGGNNFDHKVSLDFTGSYFVYLMHPTRGSAHFTLEPAGDSWEQYEPSAGWIDAEVLKPIIEEIECRRIKAHLSLS